MKRIYLVFLVILISFLGGKLYSQQSNSLIVDSIFQQWGEIYFKFKVQHRSEVDSLTRIISIDNYKGNEVFAYANRKQFDFFKTLAYHVTILPNPGGLLKEAETHGDTLSKGIQTVGQWNFYPTYQQYVDTMLYFAATYPEICRLDTIGATVLGRKLIALKISDSVNVSEAEPEFFYTSTMHGDETTGYILMLHLADSLLRGYGISPRITDMVNKTEIFINPLANPDGTYRTGNILNNPTRTNYNGYDLNRNFPDVGGSNTGIKQPETLAFMDYASQHNFVMSANFHGGAEVYNYPWDRWPRLTADDAWWRYTGREYADTVHKYSFSGYFTDYYNGITNGYAWYSIDGGRQDYMNYFKHCREVTIELSNTKFLPAASLIAYWKYNYHSLLTFIDEANYGFQGLVTDTVTGEKLKAKVFVLSHDIQADSSFIYSKLPSGFYARPINEGTYSVVFSAPGYFPKTVNNVTVAKHSTFYLDVQLRPLTFGISEKVVRAPLVYPNPNKGQFRIILPLKDKGEWKIEVVDQMGRKAFSQTIQSDLALTSSEFVLDHLPSGIYLMLLSKEGKIFRDKFMIQK